MWEYYLRRVYVKILCWFVPSKKARLALRSRLRFGKKVVRLDKVDSYVPQSVLLAMQKHTPLDFLSAYKEILNPVSLAEIVESKNTNNTMPPPHWQL
ncbi:hypothetical protein OQH61_06380 [Helicobacter sp. MIT 21-1697]|uniref:hypothetical protein n=1 Tax=Helicobacter sp. MIT 21-1697 TaxID=2993733 RepID=UPI00224AD87B|nr:hypothetical protein [Helicobacter sp. MIT 21-1697]MCX2717357.1 hypothetical protein [Helicobacter sp. MIT 21-1697]